MKRKAKLLPDRVSFDIETTSFEVDETKLSYTYSYTLCVNGEDTVLRTSGEFVEYLENIKDHLQHVNDAPDSILCVYVHNLAFEYPHIRTLFEWDDVFVVSSVRRIVRARTKCGIEFRCTYMLTNKSLENVAKELGLKKKIGDLDYSLKRHHLTQLGEAELGYIREDVKILDALIENKLRVDGSHSNIPLTSTSYVRRFFRERMREDASQIREVQNLRLTDETYALARAAYSGGYVHANPSLVATEVGDVIAYDISSSYPNSMVCGKFPVTNFVEVESSSARDLFGKCALLLVVRMREFECEYPFPPISESKCVRTENCIVDNGRVSSGESLTIVVNDIELSTIKRAYSIGKLEILEARASAYGYLPRPIVEGVIELYRDKTLFKGVSGAEDRYASAKEYVNSVYGMMATDPIRDDFTNDSHGIITQIPANIREEIDAHNKSRSRFIYYPWGGWVTAHSRARLLNSIYDIIDGGGEVIYCDTDSIYAKNSPIVSEVLEKSNRANVEQISRVATEYRFDLELVSPVDPSGVSRPLGEWSLETEVPLYSFKTLGAKRYAYQKSETSPVDIVTAGLPKRAGGEWVNSNGGMGAYTNGLTVPAGKSGKLALTYFNDLYETELVDHEGISAAISGFGGVHMSEIPFTLKMSGDYLEYLDSLPN